MSATFASAEWLALLRAEINVSSAYAEAAATWEGDFYFVLEAGHGVAREAVMYLDLWHGRCRDAAVVADRSERQPEFVVSASLPAWREVLGGKVDPIQALIMRKLKLRGEILKIIPAVKAARELVRCTTRVPTLYPGDEGNL